MKEYSQHIPGDPNTCQNRMFPVNTSTNLYKLEMELLDDSHFYIPLEENHPKSRDMVGPAQLGGF